MVSLRGQDRAGGAFDAELQAVLMGMQHPVHQSQHDWRFTIFTGSTAAMRRAMSDMPGPGQDRPSRLSTSVAVRWVPGHESITANETTDLYAQEYRRGQPDI